MQIFWKRTQGVHSKIYTLLELDEENNKKVYGFYCSTDSDLLYGKTWIPFVKKELLDVAVPGKSPNYQSALCFDKDFRQYIQDNSEELQHIKPINQFFNTFGNTECLCISYLLKGGFWDNPKSASIKNYLNTNYSDLLTTLTSKIQNLDSFENANGEEMSDFQIYQQLKNYNKNNIWLNRFPSPVNEIFGTHENEEKSGQGSYIHINNLPPQENSARMLFKDIEKIINDYIDYSKKHCRFSIFHRHGETGQKRASNFLVELSKIDDYDLLLAKISDFIRDPSKGNTNRHSLRPLLYKEYLSRSGVDIQDISHSALKNLLNKGTGLPTSTSLDENSI